MISTRTGGVGGLLTPLARPVMAAWYADVVRRYSSLPRPSDAPVGRAPGPDNLDVLIVGGDGPSVGWGVRSHGLALPGQLAREVAARTGRGATVDLIADPSLTLGTMPQALVGYPLHRYDVTIVMPGAREAITLVPPAAWRRSVTDILDLLTGSGSPDSRVVFVGCQPIRSIPAFDSPLASVSRGHRLVLNGIAADLCRRTPRARYVGLPGTETPRTGGRYRTPDDYQFWARALAPHVAESGISASI